MRVGNDFSRMNEPYMAFYYSSIDVMLINGY